MVRVCDAVACAAAHCAEKLRDSIETKVDYATQRGCARAPQGPRARRLAAPAVSSAMSVCRTFLGSCPPSRLDPGSTQRSLRLCSLFSFQCFFNFLRCAERRATPTVAGPRPAAGVCECVCGRVQSGQLDTAPGSDTGAGLVSGGAAARADRTKLRYLGRIECSECRNRTL